MQAGGERLSRVQETAARRGYEIILQRPLKIIQLAGACVGAYYYSYSTHRVSWYIHYTNSTSLPFHREERISWRHRRSNPVNGRCASLDPSNCWIKIWIGFRFFSKCSLQAAQLVRGIMNRFTICLKQRTVVLLHS